MPEVAGEVTFLSSSLAFMTLMLISIATYMFSKRIQIPYTVLLVFVGILLVPLSHTEFFSFIDHFRLTPDILFYVFLPVLLFESAYNINYKQLLRNKFSIGFLAVGGLLLSTAVIAGMLFVIFPFLGFEIPFLVCLLFGGIISATDPVAVLSIFKSVGAPRRLALIFEGESIFNDGTALAFFLVILGILLEGNISLGSSLEGIWSFLSMVLGGMIFGGLMGVGFSKLIGKIKNDESVEIGLTIIMAHLTFILSEVITEVASVSGIDIKISGVIATAVAGITLGNYGRYKISPKIEESIERYWGFFAFVANSLVFILLGLILNQVNVDFSNFIVPIFVTIGVVMFARAVSVYIPIGILNTLKLEEHIPRNWQHMLAWGSLRGALAVMMVSLIPGPGQEGYEQLLAFQKSVGWNYDFSIKDFIMIITIGSIMFTLFIKATTISYFIKKMGIDKLHDIEEFEYQEGKILMNLKVLEKLSVIEEKGYIDKLEHKELRIKYETELQEAITQIKTLLITNPDTTEKTIRSALALHALGIEKQYLKDLFLYHEIDEYNFKKILTKITRQIERVEQGKTQIKGENETRSEEDIFEKFVALFRKDKEDFTDRYMRARTRVIITRKVVKEMRNLQKIDFGFSSELFDEVIAMYEKFHEYAKERKDEIKKNHNISIIGIEAKLADKSLLKIEEHVIDDLYEKEIISPKLYLKFTEMVEEEILKDFRKIS